MPNGFIGYYALGPAAEIQINVISLKANKKCYYAYRWDLTSISIEFGYETLKWALDPVTL